jgi:hypothetical protein
MVPMKKHLWLTLIALVVAGNPLRATNPNPLPLPEANVLPEVLNDDFQFRKFNIYTNAQLRPRATPLVTRELAILMERDRRTWGAVDGQEIQERTGQYFTFFWRAKRQANLTLRFEYRQSILKNLVQARELYYPAARGSHESEFAIVGSDFSEDGRVTSWRAILIENNVIVALLQSRAWR